MNYYLQLGVPSKKIVLGIPVYGRAFTLDGEDTELGSLAKGAAEAGPSTREAGYLAYYEVSGNQRPSQTIFGKMMVRFQNVVSFCDFPNRFAKIFKKRIGPLKILIRATRALMLTKEINGSAMTTKRWWLQR